MATSLKKLQVANESQAIVDDSRWNSIKLVVNVLLSALAKYDPRFTFQSVDSKSFLTEKDTNHFELLIFLSSLSIGLEEISIHQNEVSQGMATIEISTRTKAGKIWKSLCRQKGKYGKEYLSSAMFRSKLSTLLSKLLADMLFLQHYHDKEMHGIEISNISSEDVVSVLIEIQGVALIVDLIMAINCEGFWPFQGTAVKRMKNGKNSSERAFKLKPINCGIELVSKPTAEECQWSICFYKAEEYELNFERFPERLKCLQLLKMFVHSELGCHFLKPNHLKAILLHESAKFPSDQDWSADKVLDRLNNAISLLESFVDREYCPHFFLPSINLLAEASNRDLQVFSRKLKFVKSRNKSPLTNRLRDVFFLQCLQ
ncbi:protein mab-21-like [Acropora millepora]|uniref:protein mab-21-like n=1 Tax=Acropora millepora TaxID=45264 RepID=UPI001CF1AA30|nr:protein mab-21-like [Acropora millepora]